MSKVVDHLHHRDLVVQRDAEDRRVVLVDISPLGRKTIKSAQTQLHGVMRDAVEQLSDQDLADLATASEILGRLIENVQQSNTS